MSKTLKQTHEDIIINKLKRIEAILQESATVNHRDNNINKKGLPPRQKHKANRRQTNR